MGLRGTKPLSSKELRARGAQPYRIKLREQEEARAGIKPGGQDVDLGLLRLIMYVLDGIDWTWLAPEREITDEHLAAVGKVYRKTLDEPPQRHHMGNCRYWHVAKGTTEVYKTEAQQRRPNTPPLTDKEVRQWIAERIAA